MKITQTERDERKERIIQTAFLLFCEKGIEHVAIVDIAAKASVGETTIYRYFKNKPFLVYNTLIILWREFGRSLSEYPIFADEYEHLSGREQMSLRLEGYKRLYIEKAEYILFSYEAKLYMQRHGIQLSQEEYESLMEDIKTPCIAALNKGLQDGSIKSTQKSEDLFYAIWGTIRGYIVKIVIYSSLCRDGGPWEERYDVVERGILSALENGW